MKVGESITRTIHMRHDNAEHKGSRVRGYVVFDSRNHFKLVNGKAFKVTIARSRTGRYALVLGCRATWLHKRIKGLPLNMYLGNSNIPECIGKYCQSSFGKVFPGLRDGYYDVAVKRVKP